MSVCGTLRPKLVMMMGGHELARDPSQHHETAEKYCDVVVLPDPRRRVIIFKALFQWILQRRDGERSCRAHWASVGCFRTRETHLRSIRALCAQIDPAALAALAAFPDHFGSVGT
jgi:hypothetical protein